MQTYLGLEFISRAMKRFWADHNIHHFSTKFQFKASTVERFNRTLKTKMWRYFTHGNTRRWLEYLPHLVTAYNASFHRTISRAPDEVNKNNELSIWMRNEQLTGPMKWSTKPPPPAAPGRGSSPV